MSTKKTKTNGALHAPETPILSDTTTAPRAKANGKSSKTTPSYSGPALDGDAAIDGRGLLKVLAEMRNGNFSVRMPNDGLGLPGKVYDTLNDIITLNQILVKEL